MNEENFVGGEVETDMEIVIRLLIEIRDLLKKEEEIE